MQETTAEDLTPQGWAKYWAWRLEIEGNAIIAAMNAGDLDFAMRNARHYFRAQANAIGFASR